MICETGVEKTLRDYRKSLAIAVLAGVYIGFGAQLATTVSLETSQYIGLGLSRLMSGIVFSVGLILVVIAGAELFTGNNLICVSYFYNRISRRKLLKKWVIVYLGNLDLYFSLISYSELDYTPQLEMP
jgi:formate/nitrite transporter FocA (FNT family)